MYPVSADTALEGDPAQLVAQLIASEEALRAWLDTTRGEGAQGAEVPGAVRLAALFDELPCLVAVLDAQGRLQASNRAWQQAAQALGLDLQRFGPGGDYVGACDRADLRLAPEGVEAGWALRALLRGERLFYTCEYACETPEGRRHWRLFAFAAQLESGRGALVVHWRREGLDIVDQAARNDRLLASAQRVAQIGSWEIDLDTQQLWWCDTTSRILGLPHLSERRYADFLALVEPEDWLRLAQARAQAQRHGGLVELELRIRRPDGAQRVLHARSEKICDTTGRPRRRLGVVMDVTERYRAQQASLEYEARWRLLFTRSPLPMWVQALDGRLLAVNEAAQRLYGWSAADLLGSHATAVDMTQEAPTLPHPDHRRLWLHRRRDGAAIDVELHTQPLHFEGQAAELVVAQDVTHVRRAERELRRSAALLDLAGRMAQMGAWSVELPSMRLTLSPETRRLLGLREQQWPRSRHLERCFARQWPQLSDAFKACTRSGQGFDIELLMNTADGQRRWVRVVAQPQHADNGRVVRVNGALQDISVQVQARQALREAEQARVAQAAAEAANRAKSEFLSHMSHELRTPLNAVLGFVQLLQSDQATASLARQAQWLDGIRHSGEQLLALIDDLLDVAQLETDTLVLRLQPLEAVVLAREVVQALEPAARAVGVALQLDTRALQGASLWVRADRQRLRQALLRLLGNALRASPAGARVLLRLQAPPQQGCFEVVDVGPGLSAEQQAHSQAPLERLGRVPMGDGAGLGLALVRQIMQRMEGGIDIECRAGHGMCVRLTLPHCVPVDTATQALAVAAAASQDEASAATPQGVVLYVEDNQVNALLMEQLLSRWSGVRLLLAPDGAEGLRLARSERPDLLLLDMQLPDMHGTDVMRALQADAQWREIPVVAVSANALPADVARARALGVCDYWIKPLDFAQVLDGVQRLLACVRKGPSEPL